MELSIDFVKKAYKKLKCNVYFDKTQLRLRQQMVAYEDGNIDEKLEGLYNALKGSDKKWKETQERIVKSISCKAFPKSLVLPGTEKEKANHSGAGKEGVALITNRVPEQIKIGKLQYFIDMDVEGHVLGVLWLLTIGWKLDKLSYDKSYGNRLRKLVVQELEKDDSVSYSPYLFEPYFQQYESWRDSALELAQNSINKDQDVIVFTMDFERFFYNVHFSEKVFEDILRDAGFGQKPVEEADGEGVGNEYLKNENGQVAPETGKYVRRLNAFVQEVIFQYSRLFFERYEKCEENEKRNFLPIGFLPSNILANWCLKKFDKAVSDGWNPLYFGRYVDDVIIVDKVEKNSDLYDMMNTEEVDACKVLKYCLSQCSRWNGFLPGDHCNDYALFFQKDRNSPYTLNPIYHIDPSNESKSHIRLQEAKVKMFYFKHGESSALLQCFRNQITENKSEFRFLPEDEAVFDADDYSEIYNIDNRESINKFRGVDGISINKFSLSKLLGKYLKISSLINDKVENRFAQDIEKIYTPYVIVDNYITWEKVIEIYVVNRRWRALGKFINNVFSATGHIDYDHGDVFDPEAIRSNVQKNLQEHLYSAWVRALALVWGSDAKKQIELFADKFSKSQEEIREARRSYLRTRMYDKYIVPVLLDVLGEEWMDAVDDSREISLYDFSAVVTESRGKTADYIFFPYMVTMYDLYIQDLVMSKLREKIRPEDAEESSECMIASVKNQYLLANFNIHKKREDEGKTVADKRKDAEEKSFRNREKDAVDHAIQVKKIEINRNQKAEMISVGAARQGKLKIAIANIELSSGNFVQLVKGKPNRSYARYKSLSHIANTAISEKADMLVLPEACVPIEWLPTMIRTCAKNNMALVTGIEHIICEDRVFNYTAVVLPYEEAGYRCAVLSFHLKNHYAPHETELIHGYRFREIPGKSYELYHWRDCWFPVYCCFELASIKDRALFSSYADVVVAVEWNKDINYYSNILESLSRDLHCYCVQVNSSDYGDSRITMPSKTEMKDIIKTKGGNNATVLVGTIDIEKLRNFQFKEYNLQKMDKEFKPTPPLFDKEIVKLKIQGKLADFFQDM